MNENNGLTVDQLEWLTNMLNEMCAMSKNVETASEGTDRFAAGSRVAFATALHLITIAQHS